MKKKKRIQRSDKGKILYTVKYRPIGKWIWRKIHDVKGDAFIPGMPVIQLIREDESMVEINVLAIEIAYPRERWLSICEGNKIKPKDIEDSE